MRMIARIEYDRLKAELEQVKRECEFQHARADEQAASADTARDELEQVKSENYSLLNFKVLTAVILTRNAAMRAIRQDIQDRHVTMNTRSAMEKAHDVVADMDVNAVLSEVMK